VTSGRSDYERLVRTSIAGAAPELRPDDPRAHVFFEDRSDFRMSLDPSGIREIVANRTRGASIAGRHSAHASDPEFLEPDRGETAIPPPVWKFSGRDQEIGPVDVADLILGAGNAAGAGHRDPMWSARIVWFRQAVWVGRADGDVRHDVRCGSRLEIAVRVGGNKGARVVQDVVFRPGKSPALDSTFRHAFDRAKLRATDAVEPPTGLTSAVFAPGVAGVVAHELIGHALEGDVLMRGATWIGARTSLKATTPVTVVDDPRLGRGPWLIDDEGSKSDRTVLLDRGRVVGSLLDRASAGALGRSSTGHGRRSSYLDAICPRMGCTFIESGDDDPDEVVRSTRSGVFVRRLTGGQTDPFAGRATFVVSDADRIVEGRLAEPLQDFILEVDAHSGWQSIDRVAHDLEFDACVGACIREGQAMVVSVGAPTIRIGVVRVRS
jgi:TldD protein